LFPSTTHFRSDVDSCWVPGNKGGGSETIMWKWLRKSGKRDRVVIATKIGMEMGPDLKGLSPAYIRQGVEDSLKRLQTDYIDLYQSHKDDADTPLAETLGSYARLIEAGKVRAIGASNYSAQRFEEALETSRTHNLPRYESMQPNYNLYDREDYEKDMQAVCVKQGVGVISYF